MRGPTLGWGVHAFVDGVTYLVVDPETDASGLYHGDTRHLSAISVTVDGTELAELDEVRHPPSRRETLSADVGSSINGVRDAPADKQAATVLERTQRVSQGRYLERLTVHNTTERVRTPAVELTFDADFADIFAVRGAGSGVDRAPTAEVDARSVTYGVGAASAGEAATDGPLADVGHETTVTFDGEPTSLRPGLATFEPELPSQGSWTVEVTVVPGGDGSTVHDPTTVETDPGASGTDRIDPFAVQGPVETGVEAYDRVLGQARRDLAALTTTTSEGAVPLAGAPWFVTVFGRDALLTSHLMVPFAPDLARGTLRYLAAHQGTEHHADSDQAPGKILHEVRRGALARGDGTPTPTFYGTVDATPLWVVLLQETWRWTGDDDLVAELWPALDAALSWIEDTTAEVGEDPFLYYDALGDNGVVHKTWRDSANGVQFADGSQVSPPLASAAVQGLVYAATTGAAELAGAVHDDYDRAESLLGRARRLRSAFDRAFWMEGAGQYATARTAAGELVDSATSNLGHCLWSGIVPLARAPRLADRLLEPDLFSGWGIRTTSAAEPGYRPVSYHAGSVWPHDNAIAAQGLARYGHHEAAETVAFAQFDAYEALEDRSIPELFCGFDDTRPPVAYPSACRPQAWSAAAPFGLLSALFALDPEDTAVGREPDRIDERALNGVFEYWA